MMRAAWIFSTVLWFTAAEGKTIVLVDREIVQVAAVHPGAPHASWVGLEYGGGVFASGIFSVNPDQGVLIRYTLEALPAGNRIVNAELVLPVYSVVPADGKLSVWRLLKDWGWGVSHLHRATRPERVEWAVPGARGNGVDRAATPTLILAPPRSATQLRLNVTKDLELWYSGTAPNHGWLFTGEHGVNPIHLYAPFLNIPDSWQLRITYEPL